MRVFPVTIFFICIFFAPIGVFADLEISEIMYDQEGTDEKKEWIEIHNTSNTDIDISQWHFFENKVHHVLTPDNFTALPAGQRAVVVQDLTFARSEFGSSVKLVKSSFSLNNSGETLSLSDPNKTIVFEYTYSSDVGASGNGMSLQKHGSKWIQAKPTPGLVNASSGHVSDHANSEGSDSESNQSSSDKNNSSTKIQEDYYTAHLDIDQQMIAHANVHIKAFITHTKNSETTEKLKGGIYYLNFGDGSVFESSERINLDHVYMYPGSYEVIFEFYSSSLSREVTQKPDLRIQKTIQVSDQMVSVIEIDPLSTVVLENTSSRSVDISSWRLSSGGKYYSFPYASMIAPNARMYIPRKIHALDLSGKNAWVILQNENYISISSYTKEKRVTQKVYRESIDSDTHQGQKEVGPVNLQIDQGVNAEPDNISPQLREFLEQHPHKEIVHFGESDSLSQFSGASGSLSDSKDIYFPLVILLVITCVTLGFRMWVYHRESKEQDIHEARIELINE